MPKLRRHLGTIKHTSIIGLRRYRGIPFTFRFDSCSEVVIVPTEYVLLYCPFYVDTCSELLTPLIKYPGQSDQFCVIIFLLPDSNNFISLSVAKFWHIIYNLYNVSNWLIWSLTTIKISFAFFLLFCYKWYKSYCLLCRHNKHLNICFCCSWKPSYNSSIIALKGRECWWLMFDKS